MPCKAMAGPISSPVDPPKITSPATRAADKRSIPKSPQLYKPRISDFQYQYQILVCYL